MGKTVRYINLCNVSSITYIAVVLFQPHAPIIKNNSHKFVLYSFIINFIYFIIIVIRYYLFEIWRANIVSCLQPGAKMMIQIRI